MYNLRRLLLTSLWNKIIQFSLRSSFIGTVCIENNHGPLVVRGITYITSMKLFIEVGIFFLTISTLDITSIVFHFPHVCVRSGTFTQITCSLCWLHLSGFLTHTILDYHLVRCVLTDSVWIFYSYIKENEYVVLQYVKIP